MATTLETIATYLDRRGWRYQLEPEQSRIVTGVQAENIDTLQIVIRLREDGEYLDLFSPNLLNVKDHVYKGVLFQTLLHLSWESKLLRWEYDPSDGEVRASVLIALEDNSLTERQFNRLLESLIDLVDRQSMPRIQSVLSTGNDPGAQTMESQLANLLTTFAAESGIDMAQLQQELLGQLEE
ncbi:MAG: hypothetical protein ACO3NK_13175 [Prochlorotrichaceae cyanobacterium]|jgi:hypothetical protein